MKGQTMSAQSARHPVNISHLVMGIAFLGLVAVWALIQGDVVDGGDVRWLLPIPWVLAGLAGLLATTLSSHRYWASSAASEPVMVEAYAERNDTMTDGTDESR